MPTKASPRPALVVSHHFDGLIVRRLQVCCTLLPAMRFNVFPTLHNPVFSSSASARQSHEPLRGLSHTATRTLRRQLPADSRTASPRPLPPWRYHRTTTALAALFGASPPRSCSIDKWDGPTLRFRTAYPPGLPWASLPSKILSTPLTRPFRAFRQVALPSAHRSARVDPTLQAGRLSGVVRCQSRNLG